MVKRWRGGESGGERGGEREARGVESGVERTARCVGGVRLWG